MGIKIEITGSTPLEALSTLAAAAFYCMQVPAVAEASWAISANEKSAMTPPPKHDPPANRVNPAPTQNQAAPGQNYQNPPQNQNQRRPAPNPNPAPGFGEYPPQAQSQSNNGAPGYPPQTRFNNNAPGYPPQVPVNNGAPGFGEYPPQSQSQANNGNPGYSQNQNPFPGGGPESVNANPTAPETGSNSTMNQTSLFNRQSSPVSGNPVPTSNAPGFTIQQVGRAGTDLVTANPAKRDELNALLRQYGVQTLAELKPDQLGPFALALREMGANI